MEQKLVVHKKDGTIYKGVTHDFDPTGEVFYFLAAEGGGVPVQMRLEEMKALFWVKDYIGNRHFEARRDFAAGRHEGRRAILTFHDGEEIWGTLEGDADEGVGFFVIPADPEDNNVRMFVIRSAVKDLRWAS